MQIIVLKETIIVQSTANTALPRPNLVGELCLSSYWALHPLCSVQIVQSRWQFPIMLQDTDWCSHLWTHVEAGVSQPLSKKYLFATMPPLELDYPLEPWSFWKYASQQDHEFGTSPRPTYRCRAQQSQSPGQHSRKSQHFEER